MVIRLRPCPNEIHPPAHQRAYPHFDPEPLPPFPVLTPPPPVPPILIHPFTPCTATPLPPPASLALTKTCLHYVVLVYLVHVIYVLIYLLNVFVIPSSPTSILLVLPRLRRLAFLGSMRVRWAVPGPGLFGIGSTSGIGMEMGRSRRTSWLKACRS